MTTYFKALSAAGDPENIFYDGRCLYRVRVPMPNGSPLLSRVGTVVTSAEFEEYDDCYSCKVDHTTNTMFVTYTIT